MEVTGDASLIYDSGEAVDAAAVLKAAGFDPEHFIFHVRRLPSAPNAPPGKSAINYSVSVTNRVTQRGATLTGGAGAAWVRRLAEKLAAGELE